MTSISLPRLILLFGMISVLLLTGCHSDEASLSPPPVSHDVIALTYENPLAIEVHSSRHWALLLHDRTASSGPAIQLVDIDGRSVLHTKILDYYDVFDIKFLSNNEACFAGRPQGNIGYAVQFIRLPELTLGTRVMTSDTAGTHGYLAVDSAGGAVYYSHAGGNGADGVYKISLSSKSLVDADNDNQAPFAFNNDLVDGLFNHPARIFFDADSRKLVAGNLGADYISMINADLWGTLSRAVEHTFPMDGTFQIGTTSGGLTNVRTEAMGSGAGVYVFAGSTSNLAYLARFGTASIGLDFTEAMPGRQWRYRNADLRVHPREDIFSVFVIQQDSSRIGIGQYRLNNLQQVAGSPYRPHVIPDSDVCAIGMDIILDKLIVGDSDHPRLELISLP
ncbi:hypothetical protein EHM69_07990 [candidate division KSB1 bacterium]|nr:MAG: hypothetical protein EHM69_07990 [candidate division KSB1 bacterium]